MKKLSVFFIMLCFIYINTDAQLIFTKAGGSLLGDYNTATNASINNPNSIAIDASGNIYIAEIGNQRIRKITAATGIITTVAGNSIQGFSGDGGAATSASLNNPLGVAVDAAGNIYIAEYGNHRIRKVNVSTGIISTIAGNGTATFAGDGGAAVSASLYRPAGIAIDASGNLFIADSFNGRIRKLTISTGIISTVAGNGSAAFGGDGSAATSASLYFPAAVALDASGNIFIADQTNHRIRKVTISTGLITTVAGNGTATFGGDGGLATSGNLYNPTGVVIDGSGNIFIADRDNNRIRKVTVATGIISTFAGNGTAAFAGDGAAATLASLKGCCGINIDGTGNILIVDTNNGRLRKVTVATGFISTISGNGSSGNFSGEGGVATSASLRNPSGIAFDGAGNIYIADYANHRIRKITAATGIITTVAGNGTSAFSGDGGAATSASISSPYSIGLDGNNNIYIADAGNHRIRKVTSSTGIITTVAGNGTAAFAGDGGAATSASLYTPFGIAVDAAGNLFIADRDNQRIRKVTAATNIISTIAGNNVQGYAGDGGAATSASLNSPNRVALDGSGNIYISDQYNYRIRKITISTGIIITVAGNGVYSFSGDGVAATSASIGTPTDVTLDGSGNIFIADQANNRIRKVTSPTGIITTVAGNGLGLFAGDGGAATSASLNNPAGIAVDGNGNIFIADLSNNRIRYVCAATTLASSTKYDVRTIYPDQSNTAFFMSDCALQAKLVPSGLSPVAGNINDSVWIEATVPVTTAGQPYVQRHYGINPQTNASTATGTITLYFTQAEFTAYNSASNHGLNLPIDATDAANYKANLTVNKISGTSSNGTGLFNSYTGTALLIIPASVIWNAALSAWEVTFSTTGFSGFFISSSPTVLPLSLTNFSGRLQNSDGLLSWKTVNEINTATFDVERSTDGRSFTKMGKVAAKNNIINDYNFTDRNIILLKTQMVYYRLKIIDNGNAFSYSPIIPLNISGKAAAGMLYPNPVKSLATLTISSTIKETIQYTVIDGTGRIISSKSIVVIPGNNSITVNTDPLSVGVYTLLLSGNTTSRQLKFVKE